MTREGVSIMPAHDLSGVERPGFDVPESSPYTEVAWRLEENIQYG